jgi:hypothetical protein
MDAHEREREWEREQDHDPERDHKWERERGYRDFERFRDTDREGICQSPSGKGLLSGSMVSVGGGSTKYLGLVLVVRLRVWMALVCGGFICYVIFSPYSSCFLSLPLTIFFLSFSPSPLL